MDTTVGGERRQEYFSINEYDYGDAKKRAQALNDKWRALAEEHNLIHRLNDMWLPNQVCIGLTADIERRARILNSGSPVAPAIPRCFQYLSGTEEVQKDSV